MLLTVPRIVLFFLSVEKKTVQLDKLKETFILLEVTLYFSY